MSIMPPNNGGNRPPIPLPAGPSSSRPAVKPVVVSSPSLGGPTVGPSSNRIFNGPSSSGGGSGSGGGTPPPPPPNGSGSGPNNFNWQQLGQAYQKARTTYQKVRNNPTVQKTARGVGVAIDVARAIPAPANTDFPDWGKGHVGFRGYDS